MKHYGVNTLPHVSINRALNDARQILSTIKGRNYAEADIAARTGDKKITRKFFKKYVNIFLHSSFFGFAELSYARQSLNTIKNVLFDRNLETVDGSIDLLDSRIDDLLQYLNRAMNHEREVTAFYHYIPNLCIFRLEKGDPGSLK